MERVRRGNEVGHANGGRKGILHGHPEIVDKVKHIISDIRDTGAQVTTVGIRGIMLGTILTEAPEILNRTYADGSTFRASDSFLRKWLHDAMAWSRRKAYVVKEEDIPSELDVNSDQTQVVYAPGDKTTWAPTGSKQVAVIGGEEKRAFTVMVSVASSGDLLPMQAIYTGKMSRSRPSSTSPHYNDLINAGFLLQESGTTTYWSNHNTMHDFVNLILVPYFERQKKQLGLPSSQKCLWSIDVWSVHRSKEFRDWMGANHPNIILHYIPGGCTGVFQPCDVGIQRPFKLSIKRSYHEDIVNEVMAQQKAEVDLVTLDSRLPTMRDRSTRWLWNTYQSLNVEALVKKVCIIKPEGVKSHRFCSKAFEKCVVREWNLSYTCLTSTAARVRLCKLKSTDPAFWSELTSKISEQDLPSENQMLPEDEFDETQRDLDDSDVPLPVVIKSIVDDHVPEGYSTTLQGGFEATTMAEAFEVEGQAVVEENNQVATEILGRGKRHKQPNCLYNDFQFWRHSDSDI